MTRNELVKYANSKMNEIKLKLAEDTPEVKFYEEFFAKLGKISIENIIDVSYTDLATAYLNLAIDDMSFFEIKEKVSSFSDILENCSSNDFALIDSLLSIAVELDKVDVLKRAFSDANKKGFHLVRKMLDGSATLIVKPLKEILKANDCDIESVLPLIDYYVNYPEQIKQILVFISVLNDIKIDKKSINNMIDDYESSGVNKVRKKHRKKVIDGQLQDDYCIDEIKKFIYDIQEYADTISKQNNRERRQLQKYYSAYDSFLKNIDAIFDKEEITEYGKYIKKIPSEEVRLEFLKLIYFHNLIPYQKTDLQHKKISKDSSAHYLALLKEYQILKDEINIEKVMRNSYDDVFSMLKMLYTFVEDKSIIVNALENSDLETISYLVKMKDIGILTADTLSIYPSLFLRDSVEYKSFVFNQTLFEKYNFNVSRIGNNPEVLINNSYLSDNLEILNNYGLIKSMRGVSNYSFLTLSDLNMVIDLILELGLEKYLVDDLDLLNEKNWKRLYVLKAMNYEIDTKEELLYILREDSFIVSDDSLDEYIPSVSSYYLGNGYLSDLKLEDLDEYLVNNRIYNIGGLLFSKNRVLKNYYENDCSVFDSVIDGSLISEEELLLLKKNLSNCLIKD